MKRACWCSTPNRARCAPWKICEVAGERLQVSADGYAGSAGISTSVPVAALRENTSIPFRLKLTLAGSSQLNFLPLARKARNRHQVRMAASEVPGRARAARSTDLGQGIQRPMVGARDQPELRTELVRQPGSCGRARGSGFRAKRRWRGVLRARRHLPAQLPRGALRGAAHRDHIPDVLPLGAHERHRHSRHAIPHGRPGARAVLSIAAGAVGAHELRRWPTPSRPAAWWR